ncbi:DUF2511 domain-containing protein [Streptomyces sp. NPDC058092]|uniref:DUF2511 domain-containing protein n=1 Tax=Streptomyces sp. NPDC058092 TaxID=3346336 RepID=UPI0036F13741
MRKLAALSVVSAVLLTGCSQNATKPQGPIKVTRAEYGADWPFIEGIDEGTIDCDAPVVIVFETDGERYRLNYNSIATEGAEEPEYPSAEEIVAPHPIDSWAAQGLMAETGPLIDRALDLCPE